MSGHSHWSTIKRKKEAEDIKRGRLFSKLAREITIAARSGDDPQTNFKLRLAIERAKNLNMSKENIERALRRAQGKLKGGKVEEVVYEGFGPAKVGIIVKATTDNRQRTTAEMRKIFERGGGSLAGPGAVAHQFQSMGLVALEKGQEPQKTILKIIDFDVEDVEEAEDAIEVYTEPKDLEATRKKLEKAGFQVKSFELVMKPLATVPIKDKKTAERLLNLMEVLEEHPDVEKTYANFDIDPQLLDE